MAIHRGHASLFLMEHPRVALSYQRWGIPAFGAALLGYSALVDSTPKPYGNHRHHDRGNGSEEIEVPTSHGVDDKRSAGQDGCQRKQRRDPLHRSILVSHDAKVSHRMGAGKRSSSWDCGDAMDNTGLGPNHRHGR